MTNHSISRATNTRFGVRRALAVFFLAVAIYFCVGGMYLLLDGVLPDDIRLAMLHLGAALALYLVWCRGRWGIARYDSYGAALLLLAIIIRLLDAIDAIFYGIRADEFPSTVPFPEDFMGMLLKSESIAFAGIVIVAIIWRTRIGCRVESFSFLYSSFRIDRRMAWLVYLMALAIGVLKRAASVKFGPLEQVFGLLYQFGVASIFFITAVNHRKAGRFIKALLLGLPLVLVGLASGMKEVIFFPLVPAFVLYWFDYRGKSFRIAALVFGVLVLALSQLYVHHVRVTNWYSQDKLSTIELVFDFVSAFDKMDFGEGLEGISSRLNMTSAHAITVTLAETRGFEPKEIFGGIPASVIPRMFWSNKPIQQPGTAHTARISGRNVTLSKIRTSTASGFITEMYLGGGYGGMLVCAALFGLLVASLQLVMFKLSPEFGHFVLAFTLAYSALRFDETHVVYAYTGMVFSFALLIVVVQASRLLKTKKIASRKSQLLPRVT